MMDMSDPAFEFTREAEITLAEMIDYFREYRKHAELYTEVQKLEVHDPLQSYIDELKSHDVFLRYAECKTHNSDLNESHAT